MHSRPRAFLAFSALLLTGQTLSAQTADLRYRAPLPESVTYVTIDSMSMTMSGTPMGDMTTTTFVHSVNELTFAAAEGSPTVTAVLVELRGTSTSPMGNMPITAGNVPALTIRLTEKGPDPQDVAAKMAPSPDGFSPGDVMGSAKAGSGLLTLPGRELTPGETWSDTVMMKMSPVSEGLKSETVIVTHGTYSGDTVQDGRTLNVLNIRTEMTIKMNGTVRGMAMTQQTTMNTDERILWDSTRHYSPSRDAAGEVRTEVSMTDQGMTLVTTGRTRTITTEQPES